MRPGSSKVDVTSKWIVTLDDSSSNPFLTVTVRVGDTSQSKLWMGLERVWKVFQMFFGPRCNSNVNILCVLAHLLLTRRFFASILRSDCAAGKAFLGWWALQKLWRPPVWYCSVTSLGWPIAESSQKRWLPLFAGDSDPSADHGGTVCL